jgi:hypothetical protein
MLCIPQLQHICLVSIKSVLILFKIESLTSIFSTVGHGGEQPYDEPLQAIARLFQNLGKREFLE